MRERQYSQYIDGYAGRNRVKGLPGKPKYTREQDREMSLKHLQAMQEMQEMSDSDGL